MGASTKGAEASLIDVSVDRRVVREKYNAAERRLIIVDYDGVLVPEQRRPGFVIPSKDTKATIKLLGSDPQNTVMLMSGRDRHHMELHWSPLDIVLVAEHGAQFRDRSMAWHSLFDIDDEWMDSVDAAMQTLPFEYDGSFLERRTHSIAWHFMPSTPTIQDIPQIIDAIRALPQHNSFEVYQLSDRVELAPRGVDPGSFMARWIGGRRFDLVIAVGAGRMEESLFRILTRDAVTVSVSPAMTSTARYSLKGQTDVVPFLRSLPGIE